MANIVYMHFNQEELKNRVKELRSHGHKVAAHWSTEKTWKPGKILPDAMVLSLDRLPSHGRAYAEWFWEAKKRQHIPIIFAGGKADKVAETKKKFPDAVYCYTEDLSLVIADLLA